MPDSRPALPSWLLPVAVLLILTAGLIYTGVRAYHAALDGARTRAAAELEAVAQLKIEALISWRRDLEQTALLAADVARPAIFRSTGTVQPASQAQAMDALADFARHEQWEQVLLIRTDGEPLLRLSRPEAFSAPPDLQLIARAFASRAAVTSALHVPPGPVGPRLDAVLPLRDEADGADLAIFVRTSPAAFLRDLTTGWPIHSATARTSIFAKQPNGARFSVPRVTVTDTAEALALSGPDRTFTAPDASGQTLLCVTRSVPDSDWHILTRVSMAEIEAPLARQATTLSSLLVLFLGTCGIALALWWHHESAQHQALRHAQEELTDSEERLKLALAGSHFVWEWDLSEGRFSLDPEWSRSLGWPNSTIFGQTDDILVRLADAEDYPETLARWRRHAASEAPIFEAEYRLPGDRRRWILTRGRVNQRDTAGNPLHATGVMSDVTDLHDLRDKLDRTQRLASVGTLAAGVAHEVNNPLAYVLASIVHLDEELREVAPDRLDLLQAVRDARDGAERVRDVVRALKAFSRPSAPTQAAVDVGEEVAAALRLSGNEIRHRARLETHLAPMPRVLAPRHELGQVFLNLIVNAAQALPDGRATQHVVSVSTGTDAQGWAFVEVRDTGSGIPPEVLPRIFEPFFTTKPHGIGTGLGLALAHGIVHSAGGRIDVDTRLGVGSTFRVLLPPAHPGTPIEDASAPAQLSLPGPLQAHDHSPKPIAPPLAAGPATPRPGALRVLVVDDDPLVARAIVRSLGKGHAITAVSSGHEVLERVARGESFDVVLCDLMMPEMTGMELHEEISARAPALARRFVFLTGGAFTEHARSFLERTPNLALEKPFEPASLREMVIQVAREADAGSSPKRKGAT